VTHRRKPDHYTRLAHERSYPARSVFKLEEIDRRTGLLHRGDRVLDLGASPGSWMKYILERVGPEGLVAGVDLSPLAIELPPHARFVEADVLAVDPEALRRLSGGGSFDVVVSDLAPKTTGIRHADQELSWELFARAVFLAGRLLARGGSFTGKLFFSPRHGDAVALLDKSFSSVKTLQPRATRRESKEIFIVAKGFEGLRR
jgi:23S rRNA (uridine2552-2'-O)-methyltransferase